MLHSKHLLILTAVALLAVCGTALAAGSILGQTFTGYTSAPAISGHRGPVNFKVSSTGHTLLGFSYGNIGCTAMSSLKENPYTNAAYVIKVGTLSMSGTASYSATNVKSTYLSSKTGQKYVTISTVTVKFKNVKSASGTVSFSQKITAPGRASNSCGPYELSFTAAAK